MPCEGGTPKLDAVKVAYYRQGVPQWRVEEDRLKRTFSFADFVRAIAFIDRVAKVAEEQGHHPDFAVHYNRIDFTVWTHAIGGLSENDFILAAKIDALA
jgi:4a-hydroxytetrahydrobiopterin dehydratase